MVKVVCGVNDLATTHPNLVKEWNYNKNKDLKPTDITYGSTRKVWWILQYDVPDDYFVESLRGKHFDFEWQETVGNRVNGRNCPFLSGHRIWPGYNDLKTTHPHVAKEWHSIKNGDLTPDAFSAGSNAKVWWQIEYYDAELGKKFLFEWEARIVDRCLHGSGCPYLSNNQLYVGFNDLATRRPDLAKEWHPTKNGSLRPVDVTVYTHQYVWWLKQYTDPVTKKYFEFEWYAQIKSRVSGVGCPFISNPPKKLFVGFNDLSTVNPALAAEWHPTKNGDLKPMNVFPASNKNVWWKCSEGHEWRASIFQRMKGHGCPYCANQKVIRGYNDFATLHPDLAAEWHPTKNGDLKPYDVFSNSRKKVWWCLSYDDSLSGKHYDFEWLAALSDRVRGSGCPYLTESYGEQHIHRYLVSHNIDFEYEKSFEGLLGVGLRSLTYDFAIKKAAGCFILIEYHGKQHYESVDYFGGDSHFEIQKEHDERKRVYAAKHNYVLIEIPYKYDTYQKIEAFLDDKLLPLL